MDGGPFSGSCAVIVSSGCALAGGMMVGRGSISLLAMDPSQHESSQPTSDASLLSSQPVSEQNFRTPSVEQHVFTGLIEPHGSCCFGLQHESASLAEQHGFCGLASGDAVEQQPVFGWTAGLQQSSKEMQEFRDDANDFVARAIGDACRAVFRLLLELWNDARGLSTQHDSKFRTSSARQIQPKASRVGRKRRCADSTWTRQGLELAVGAAWVDGPA